MIARHLFCAVAACLVLVTHAQVKPLFPPWFWLVVSPISVFEECSIRRELRAEVDRQRAALQHKLSDLVETEVLEQIAEAQRSRIDDVRASNGRTADEQSCRQALAQLDMGRIRFAVAELKADEANDRELARRLEYLSNRQPFQIPQLGVKIVVDKDAHQKVVNGVSRQVVVVEVIPGSPASAAGIREGDQITRIGSASIARPSDFVVAILNLTPGTTYSIEVVRQVEGLLKLEFSPSYTRAGDDRNYGVY